VQLESLAALIDSEGVDATLERVADQLRDEQRYHELFDLRLMQCRRKLGLPIILTGPLEELDEDVQQQIEEASLAACREVGEKLLGTGRIQEAWMYLRPAGERKLVAEAIAGTKVNDENLEELIEVALREGVDPQRGFELILQHHGTCNAITTYEMDVSGRGPAAQQFAIGLLVRHLYQELVANVRADVERQQGREPEETSLVALVADRPWLFADENYHTDTTHLAAVVRFARKLQDTSLLPLAIELTEYGQRLSPQFQMAGDEPFAEYYPGHAMYFRAMLGDNVDEAIEYFGQRARAVNVEEEGTLAVEVYVKLLAAAGRYREAIDALLELVPRDVRLQGFAPTMLELSRLAGDYRRMMDAARERDDAISYVAGLVESHAAAGEE